MRSAVSRKKSPSFEKMGSWVESLPSQRENLLLILEVAKTLLRDLIIVKTLKNELKLIHSDLFQAMELLATNWLVREKRPGEGTGRAVGCQANAPRQSSPRGGETAAPPVDRIRRIAPTSA